ncbi:protein kinase domain-containing protein [Sorangium sp. So ce1335]|uniref:protein kinase domain-containing protein n=1 Tax=Sorangium sp. So ce1335 TaxID=3133335 RepID=UPI003F5E04B4
MSNRTIARKYTLTRQIGHGGMGVIWEAFDEVLRRAVALKVMTPEHVTSDTARRRFQREATAIARLRNEHIVQIHDYGIDEDCPYIVMELLEGEDLENRLNRERQLSPSATLSLLRQIAIGLQAANSAGIVHRDLKPANVFMARKEPGECVKLLDFGVVWTFFEGADESQQRSSGRAIGTPAYMSPEQVRAVEPDHRSDLWSLGVIAYRALTGRLPFAARGIGELLISICTDPFPPPSSLAPGLQPGFDGFFQRALAKDPAQRFQSARELVAAFAAVIEASSGPTKILVADDEPDVTLMMKLQFRQKIRDGIYEFIFAGNGEAALHELRRHPDVDVILTDIKMPVMDGLTFLGRVPEVNPFAKTVMVSAYGDMVNIRSAMNQGAFDFLLKPIHCTDLEATIDKTARHVAELRRNARSDEENKVLRQFTSAAVVERIREMGPAIALASEAVMATVAFIDIFQFTQVTKERPPGEAMRLLRANFEVIVPELMAKGGVVDKYLGDAVMAVFQGPDHLPRALSACAIVRAQMAAVARRAGESSPYTQGICIGLSTGQVLSGSVGSQAYGRLDYTVLGEAVNTAAHLARAARPGEILVDAPVREAARALFDFEEVGGRCLVPGGSPVNVFNVVRRSAAALLSDGEPTVAIATTTTMR